MLGLLCLAVLLLMFLAFKLLRKRRENMYVASVVMEGEEPTTETHRHFTGESAWIPAFCEKLARELRHKGVKEAKIISERDGFLVIGRPDDQQKISDTLETLFSAAPHPRVERVNKNSYVAEIRHVDSP